MITNFNWLGILHAITHNAEHAPMIKVSESA